MKIEINVPDGCYEEIKEAKFPAQDTYRLIAWIKEGKIIEDKTDNFIEVGTLKDGNVIKLGGLQMEILDNAYIGNDCNIYVLCMAQDILFTKSFDKENDNDWKRSSLRAYLNGEYLNSLDKELVNALVPFERNLMTNDGRKNYGTCIDRISIISEREFQDYRDYISNKSNWWWTLTAWSASYETSNYVLSILKGGTLDYNYASNSCYGVVPMFLLKLDTKVKVID